MKRFYNRYHLHIFSVLTLVTVLYCVLKNHTNRQHHISPKQVIDTALQKNNEVIEKKIIIPVKILEGTIMKSKKLNEHNESYPFNTTRAFQCNLIKMNLV